MMLQHARWCQTGACVDPVVVPTGQQLRAKQQVSASLAGRTSHCRARLVLAAPGVALGWAFCSAARRQQVVGLVRARSRRCLQVPRRDRPEGSSSEAWERPKVKKRMSKPRRTNGESTAGALKENVRSSSSRIGLAPPPLLVDKAARHAAPPSPHVVMDSWCEKLPHAPTEESGVGCTKQAEAPRHIGGPHYESFQRFLAHDLPELFKQKKHLATLDATSVVIVSREELLNRDLHMRQKKWREAPQDFAAVELSTMETQQGGEATRQLARFQVELLPDLLYYEGPTASADEAYLQGETFSATLFIPARVKDSVMDMTHEVHVDMGSIPMMSEAGTLQLKGNRTFMVHRLIKSPGVYYSVEEKNDSRTHSFTFITLGYSRVWVRCQDGGVPTVHIEGRNAPFPAATFLRALGFTDSDLAMARNGDVLLGGEPMDQMQACQEICNMMRLTSGWYRPDAIAAFHLRMGFLDDSLGELGRERLNKRLGIKLGQKVLNITPHDILAAMDLLIEAGAGAITLQVDDVDSLMHKRLRLCGEAMSAICQLWLRNTEVRRGVLPIKVDLRNRTASLNLDGSEALDICLARYLNKENALQMHDDTNPLSSAAQACRITQVGDQGLDAVKRIRGMRLIHHTHYGRICPVETGDGQVAGIVLTLVAAAKVSPHGEILVPHQRVINGKRQWNQPWEYLLPNEQDASRAAQFDNACAPDGAFIAPASKLAGPGQQQTDASPNSITVTHLGGFTQCRPEQVQYVACGCPLSVGVSLIPFVEHDDANRALMGSKMMQQAVPCLWPERPLVGTGMEAYVAACSSWNPRSEIEGQVLHADGTLVTVVSSEVSEGPRGSTDFETLEQQLEQAIRGPKKVPLVPSGWTTTELQVRSEMAYCPLVDADANKKHTLRHQTATVNAGEQVGHGDALAEGAAMSGGELSLGKNLVVAYMPFEGYNYEDAIVVSKRVVREEILTSIHIHEVEVPLMTDDILTSSPFINEGATQNDEQLAHLDGGLVRVGTFVEEGEVIVGRQRPGEKKEDGEGADGSEGPTEIMLDYSVKVPPDVRGRVIDSRIVRRRVLEFGEYVKTETAIVHIAMTCRLKVGDKLAGRHGNKGIVSRIMEDRDMPYLPDGTPIDVILNPLGVPSRMNVGQIYECLLGSACRWTGKQWRIGPFDEMFSDDASRSTVLAALRHAQETSGNQWLLDPRSPGKMRMFDGRTGTPFEQPVAAGVSYILKLYHMVRDKIASRGTHGLRSQLTQQPAKGRTKKGGLRLGEMEVSAFVGYGAHAALQELLTVKSDDVGGRAVAKRAMMEGKSVPLVRNGSPEAFRVFQRELAAGGFALTEEWVDDADVLNLGE